MKQLARLLVIILTLIFLFAGQGIYASSGKGPAVSPPPAHPTAKDTKSLPPLSGKVIETMNSGGYTYICLEKNGKKIWTAAPEMNVSVGQEISLMPGQEMSNFTSKTLNRTFDKIIFSPGPVSPQNTAAGTVSGSKSALVVSSETISVEKAAGPDAYTVVELYANRAKLHKKNVVIRGKVVKVSAGIMDRNWIHLQDGSGDPKKGTHNLVVTSNDLPSIGDVVTISGTLYKNKDFGAGYYYKVIVEKGRVIR